MENIELAYNRIVGSITHRSGVMLSQEAFNDKGSWRLRGGRLTRKSGSYLVQRWGDAPYITSESIQAGLANYPLKAAKAASLEWFFLLEGRSIPLTKGVEDAIEERISLDTLLLSAVEEGKKVAQSPYYGDGQFDTHLGFIHQTGGGRLTLCTEAEHIRWIEHYEAVRASYDQFWARQQEIKDAHQRRVMA